MKAHQPRALLLRAKTILHHPIPDLACRPVLGDLFKEIVVRVEKETEARAEFIYIKSTASRPFHIFHAVIQRESKLLERGRARLANVISADGNRIEARREFRSEFERID